MHREGLGTLQDYAEAIRWFRETINSSFGHAAAQNALGSMHEKGMGTVKDNIKAHMWWNLADYNGNAIARENRDEVEKIMTSLQVIEAQSLARECIDQYQQRYCLE